MTVSTTQVENLYRPPHEAIAAGTWLASGVATALGSMATGLPWHVGATMSVSSFGMGAWRAYETYRLFEAKLALAGQQFWMIKSADLNKAIAQGKDQLYLGRGFQWTATHTERAIEINRHNPEMIMPPRWALRLMRRPFDFEAVKGATWIHGVEPNEQPVVIPWAHSEGNWSIFGTTGAGKTRLYELLCYQMVKRGDVVIFFDPKYDKDLRNTLIDVCKAAGRPEAFCEFHPAFPERSCRIDPTKNFNRETEIASRVADLLGADGSSDNFVAFSWRVLFAITGGLIYIGERPSLKKLRFFIESGPEPLVEKVLTKFLGEWEPGTWENHVEAIVSRIENKKMKPRLQTGTTRQAAMLQVYHEMVPVERRRDDINALVSVTEHSREHMGKMITVMVPLLTQLTAKPLDELLSPDYDDPTDSREILDMEKVIKGKRVLYVATDSLADATVGSAIAGILLADLRAVAGARYNYGSEDDTKIHILCDEACEIVNAPLIALMNKGRGAGMISYLATQNFSDYIARFGNEDRARMVVGNGNNRLSLRVVDTKTQKYVCENLGTVNVRQVGASAGSGSKTEDGGMEFSGNVGTSVSQREAELFPAYLLGKLPDLHYVAAISGGKVVKGRIPKII